VEEKSMNNPKMYQVLSVLGFVVSAIFTIKLFCSNSTDLISWFAMVVMAILYEFGKYTLLYQGLKGRFQLTGKTILLSAWGFVTAASIMASATYVLNDANVNKNIQIQDSAAYANQQNNIKIQNDLYSTTKKQIDDLKVLQEQQRLEGERIINSMPKNYIDRKNQQRSETQALISKTQNEINKKSEQLLSIAAGISSPAKIEVETESTSGGESMFKLIAQKLNERQRKDEIPYSTEQVSLFFYIAIGVGLELLANLFAFLSQYYRYGGILEESFTPPPKKKAIPTSNDSPNFSGNKVIQGGRLKGLKLKNPNNVSLFRPKKLEVSENTNISEDDIQKYLRFIFENRTKSGNAPGRNKIVQGVGFNQEKCRTIHNLLKDRGYIATGDGFTRIIREVV
jgi:hypothetical protein